MVRKKESILRDFDYNKVVEYAEKICSNQKQTQDFIKKIKKFKKELRDE